MTENSVLRQPGLAQGLPVDVDRVADRRDGLAGETDDPFHEILVSGVARVLGRLAEHKDAAAIDRVAELEHEHAIADLQRRHHRRARHVERLDDEEAQPDGQGAGHEQDEDPAEEGVSLASPVVTSAAGR